VATLFRVPVKK